MRLHRVVGPPGCGKTTWLAQQAKNAVRKYGSNAVVIASLTRAAAAEVAGRDTNIHPDLVGTLHAHAFRALGKPPLAESRDGLKAWNEDHPTLRMTGGVDASDPYSDRTVDSELQTYTRLRTAEVPRRIWATSTLSFAKLWEDWKQQTNRLDFCDLIEKAAVDTEVHPAVPAVLMIDEAQDISALERRLVERWSAETEQVVIVGDPDQNLYEWRGSDPAVFWQGEAETERVLEQSYRVPRDPHAYAVAWIDRTPGRSPVVYRPTDEQGWVRPAGCTFDDPYAIVEYAAERESTTMVLASCSYMLKPILEQLRLAGVPFHNPYRVENGAWNPLAGTKRLAAFLRSSPAAFGEHARHWTWEDVWRFVEPMRAEHFTRGAKAYIERQAGPGQFGDRARSREGVDAAWLVENMTEEAAGALGAYDVQWWLDSLLASQRSKHEYAVSLVRRRGAEALHLTPRVIVGTIHSVKGGEADDVFVAPDLSLAADRERRGSAEGREAIRRMFYVAFTRTRRGLFVAEPSGPRFARLATSL